MTPTTLSNYLQFCIANNFPVLIKGRPGIGKTDIVKQAAEAAGARIIISHPVVSDPTDYKGLPFPQKNGTADFLPYGSLKALVNATEKTVYFLDDLGQASPSVQAACMQLLLERRINDHQVSELVTFIAATNRREDKAAVNGLLEPVKSRFASIIELEVATEDWVQWALVNNMPVELIAFIRFRPALLHEFVPSKDIVNSVSPRTLAFVGKQQQAGISQDFEFEAFAGAAGEAFAVEYRAFLRLYRNLPSVDEVILNPTSTGVPSDPGALFAICGALAARMNDRNIPAICTYLDRLPKENSVACMKDAARRDKEICNTHAYIKWATSMANTLL